VRTAIRRSHNSLIKEDLKSFRRKKSGKKEIVFVLDASGSMKGNKIDSAKKAGVALAYKSIDNKDEIGLIVFSNEVKRKVELTSNLGQILNAIVKVKPSKQTHLSKAIMETRNVFSHKKVTKHIILITDAVPTVGDKPEDNVLKEVSICRSENISISIVGIELDDKGKKLGKRIAEISEGRLYLVKKDEKLDRIVLLDYSLMG
jgi:Mg-chelatase subunit ChlD